MCAGAGEVGAAVAPGGDDGVVGADAVDRTVLGIIREMWCEEMDGIIREKWCEEVGVKREQRFKKCRVESG